MGLARNRCRSGTQMVLALAVLAASSVTFGVARPDGPTEALEATAAADPNLTITVAGPAQLRVGDAGEFAVNVENLGEAVDAEVTVEIYVGFLTSDVAVLTHTGAWTCESMGYAFSCTQPALAAGTSIDPIIGSITPTAVSDPLWVDVALRVAGSRFEAYDALLIDLVADVDLAILGARSGPILPGEPYEIGFTVSNEGSVSTDFLGPVEVQLDAFFWDGVSGGDGGITVSGVGWMCTAFVCQHPGPVPAAGSLPPIAATGTFTNAGRISATVTTPDELPNDNTFNYWVEPSIPNLAVYRSTTSPNPAPGANASVQFGVYDNSSSVTYAGEITLVIDTGYVGATATGGGWACGSFVNGRATCTRTTAGEFGYPTLMVSGTAPSSGSSIVTTATVSPGGWNTTDDRVTYTQPIAIPPGHLAVSLTSSLSALTYGGPFDATAVVSNDGLGDYTSPVRLRFSMPSGVAVAAGSGWTCTLSECTNSGPIVSGGALAPIVFTSSSASVFSAPNVSAGPQGGATTATAQLDLPIVRPDLSLSISSVADPVDEGSSTTFDYAVTNIGPGTAYGTTTVSISSSLVGSDRRRPARLGLRRRPVRRHGVHVDHADRTGCNGPVRAHGQRRRRLRRDGLGLGIGLDRHLLRFQLPEQQR